MRGIQLVRLGNGVLDRQVSDSRTGIGSIAPWRSLGWIPASSAIFRSAILAHAGMGSASITPMKSPIQSFSDGPPSSTADTNSEFVSKRFQSRPDAKQSDHSSSHAREETYQSDIAIAGLICRRDGAFPAAKTVG